MNLYSLDFIGILIFVVDTWVPQRCSHPSRIENSVRKPLQTSTTTSQGSDPGMTNAGILDDLKGPGSKSLNLGPLTAPYALCSPAYAYYAYYNACRALAMLNYFIKLAALQPFSL